MKEQKDFIIPEHFLKQLQEFSNGGFILLTFTNNGNPAAYQFYESKKDRMAMEAFLEKFAQRATRINLEDEEREESTSASNEENDGDDSDKESSLT